MKSQPTRRLDLRHGCRVRVEAMDHAGIENGSALRPNGQVVEFWQTRGPQKPVPITAALRVRVPPWSLPLPAKLNWSSGAFVKRRVWVQLPPSALRFFDNLLVCIVPV
jgi:hypothetical protein